ncbi:MAG TPA: hypothetical protein VNR60_05925 [Croceibacterium sp.]|nr:hypothetical protein [Croceibacterium sp.]
MLNLDRLTEAARSAYQYSSGRMIALTRVVLAFVFLFALWIDPDQPARVVIVGYILLGGYFLLAIAMLALSWRSWWWDHRLAWPLMAVDICAFL